jgi:hypothetical protein
MATKKPKFYQVILQEVKGNVLDHVYPHLTGKNQMTMTERMGSEQALCEKCLEEGKKSNKWMILSHESEGIAQGGKPYIECLCCGHTTHL